MPKVKVDMMAVLSIATKIIRYARGGFTREEVTDLVADLLELAAELTRAQGEGL
jgi:hypothetical protein